MTMNRKIFLLALPLAALLWAPISNAGDHGAPAATHGTNVEEDGKEVVGRSQVKKSDEGTEVANGRRQNATAREGTEVVNGRRQMSAGSNDRAGEVSKPSGCTRDLYDCPPYRKDK